MDTVNRQDFTFKLLGEAIEATGKRMPNGEVRRRVRFADDTKISHTTAMEGGWQDGHYHKGITEFYFVVKGRIAIVLGDRILRLYSAGSMITALPGDSHNVYLFSQTTIMVFTYGEPIGDPNRKGNDWYEAHGIDSWSKELDEETIVALGSS